MQTERGFDRMVNFCDAVVAIAITLLVLPLVDVPAELAAGEPIFRTLRDEHGGALLGFFLSFAVIARFWMGHHAIYEKVAHADRVLLRLNILWLLTIVFLPFPTEVLGTVGSGRGSASLYIGTLLLSSVTLSALSRAAARPGIAARPETPDEAASRRAGELSNPVLLSVALVLAATIDGVGPWALFLLFLDGPLVRLLRPWERRRLAAAGPAAASSPTSGARPDGIDHDGPP